MTSVKSGVSREDSSVIIQDDLNDMCQRLDDEFSTLSGQSLLITGGAGFLGYYLVQAALHWNTLHDEAPPIRVIVLDNFQRGVPAWLSNCADRSQSLRTTRHDITQPLPDAVGDVQYIVHAASIASPTYYREHPIKTMDANVMGLRHLLDYAVTQRKRGTPVHGFLFFSSSEVYGDPDPAHIPTPETYWGRVSFTGPRACYDESKRFGETLCVNYHAVHDLPIKVARPFNNYGPGLKITDRRVLPDFARDVLAQRDIVMLSDGSPTRTFCYVTDAIVGYYKVLMRGQPAEAYNIGVEGPEVSIYELAQRTATIAHDLFGYDGDVRRQQSEDPDYLKDNPNRRCPDIQKARDEIDYDPSVGLKEGIRRSLLWYYDHQHAEDA
jgi:nucleoside-diphosphate-sugar epimerase